jgi:hypothetical protein
MARQTALGTHVESISAPSNDAAQLYAGFWRRCGAYAVDLILLEIALGIVGAESRIPASSTSLLGAFASW